MHVNIEDLKFDEKGLIPAVVIDSRTKKVLTVAYMNQESLAISLKEGRTCFGPAPGRSFGERERPPAMYSISCASIRTVTVMP